MAIQYTIELRKMLNDVPVQEGVREFLFQVWADVLATTAVKSNNADATKDMKRAAADLIWSASAKVSRAERAEVIRRLPPLLKTLREGMDDAGIPVPKQDEHIQRLNNSLAAAFTAKAAAISPERLEELMGRLETLEELLPEAEDVDIDESLVMDLSGHESSELEVVGEGGSMPTPAMLAWARELQVGSWYMLDYRNRNEAMQLAWQGMRRQLTLFVSPQGRGVLFQQHRLAAFLQAGLLVPAQEEALTVRATRSAMAKLDGDPSRLLDWRDVFQAHLLVSPPRCSIASTWRAATSIASRSRCTATTWFATRSLGKGLRAARLAPRQLRPDVAEEQGAARPAGHAPDAPRRPGARAAHRRRRRPAAIIIPLGRFDSYLRAYDVCRRHRRCARRPRQKRPCAALPSAGRRRSRWPHALAAAGATC